MADATWPATLPEKPERDGYNEDVTPNVSSFDPDVGPPTAWRRSTLDGRKIRMSFVFTNSQRDTFLTFYRSTLFDGVRPFLWTNPSYGVEKRYLFDPKTPPAIESIGHEFWKIQVSVFKLN